ncbi:MAG: hypothetical protein A3C06_02800 [Candidatus Taylorbacteria bacterium RIFCSPHIGHO2_02_FULL_46_13]|uniref:DUF1868 domain-containing protein n=1 Tax=Candidatus Taylorbacteria bacterium RIFCSPHIGHO2_02_FULL_46_13 TaxID=1802312 RepID=A0A1G2MU51_9BACT|nr:MAG: hypothetical protein A3C06_02800 [Candidatus Taylorbacteria bacterium RIFCSPHIGHO2_02_FULL_46_13]
MNKTLISNWLNKPDDVVMLNACFSLENKEILSSIQKLLQKKFPDIISCTRPHGLHITLMEFLSLSFNYGQHTNKKRLLHTLFHESIGQYDKIIVQTLEDEKNIRIDFKELRVMPNAILVVGTDNGAFKRVRDNLINKIDLIPGTKAPPQIIYSTICRYASEGDLQTIRDFVQGLKVSFVEIVKEFRLTHESVPPASEFEIVKTYPLGTLTE